MPAVQFYWGVEPETGVIVLDWVGVVVFVEFVFCNDRWILRANRTTNNIDV